MKKICLLTILFLTGAVITVVGFLEPEPIQPVPTEATELPALSTERLRAEEQGREALRVYILGRVSIEKIAREEKEGNGPKVVSWQKTRKYWQETRQKAEAMKNLLLESKSAAPPAEKQVSMFLPVMNIASASIPLDRKKEVELTEERKRIIASYDAYPYADNLQCLAGQIEHDAALMLELLDQAEEGKLSAQQAALKLTENCQIKLTASDLGGSLVFLRPEGHEAFAWFWGGTETFVRVEPQGTILLLGKLPDIVFLTGDTAIKMGEKPLSALDLDTMAQKYTGTASQ